MGANRRVQGVRRSAEKSVPGLVTMGVVRPLETVEVDGHDRSRMTEPLAALLLSGERPVPRPPVGQAREPVQHGEVFQVLGSTLALAYHEVTFQHRAEELSHELDHRLLGEDVVPLLVRVDRAQGAEEGSVRTSQRNADVRPDAVLVTDRCVGVAGHLLGAGGDSGPTPATIREQNESDHLKTSPLSTP